MPYNTNKKTPLLLPKCGHSMCKECIERRFQGGKIACIKCKRNNYAETISEFPKNLTILELYEDQKASNGSLSFEISKDAYGISTKFQRDEDEFNQFTLKEKEALNLSKELEKDSHVEDMGKGEADRPINSSNLLQKISADFDSKLCSFEFNNSNFEFTSNLVNQELCEIHKKKIEAFCFKDGEFLCLNCLIENSHQSHEICDIENAFCIGLSEIERKLNMFTQHKKFNCQAINEKAEQSLKTIDGNSYYATKKVELFFAEIINSINDRKNEILNNIR